MNTKFGQMMFTLVILIICIIGIHQRSISQNVPFGAIVWSPDDTRVAISTLTDVEIRDAVNNQVLLTITPDSEILDLEWSPNGDRLAGSGVANDVYIWSTANGALLGTLTGAQERSDSLAWHPNGTTLFSLGLDQELLEWNTTSFTLISAHNDYVGAGRDLKISSNGEYLAIGVGGAIQLYNLNNWNYTFVSTEHESDVVSVSWNGDNNRLASGDTNGNIYVWDINNSEAIFALNRQNNSGIGGIVHWLDDKLLADRGIDGIIRIWNTTTSQMVYSASNSIPGYIDTFAWNNVGSQIVYGTEQGTIQYETPDYSIISSLILLNANIDNDIRTLSTTSTETIDIASNDIAIRANTAPATVGSVVFSVDGNVVATDNSAPYTIAGENGSDILPWNIALGQHTVVATPYSGADGTGDAGTPLTVQVNIVDSSQTSGQSITSLTLINADTDVDIRTLSTTGTETIDITNNTVSIRANTNPATVGSVVFSLDGLVIQTEGIAPYTIAGDQSSGTNYNPWTISPGTYTLTVTPYDGSGGTGNAGTPMTVNLEVVDSTGSSCTPTGGLLQEAEDGVLAGNFVIGNDSIASGGQYVHVPNGSGNSFSMGSSSNVSFCFPVTDAGTYRLRAWVYTPNSGDDSFFVDYNGATLLWNTEINSIYSMGYVHASGTPANSAQDYTLSAGNHVITFFLREDGARIDKVELVNNDPGETVLYRVDAGATSTYTDSLGNVWSADSNYSGAQANTWNATILSTIDDPLYTTERSQSNNAGFSYSFPVSNGTYTVRLHFAEIWFTGLSGRGALDTPTAQRRVFDVQIEGITVLDEFHIVSETLQPRVALIKTFTVNVTDGSLDITFPPATTDNPTIEAIEIVQGGS